MGAPADGKRDVTVRFTERDVEQIDHYCESEEDRTGEDCSRAKGVRKLVRKGLDASE